ncbi:MAG: hypothetical protein A3D31_07045 [Candidatus Fluviicola riflensis]|nr:MAG: hypothetical protein CHH17_07965 [Candidatus Fluviicola riflensis]OGS79709.1 MAG: hypothetical protein A3D31_07045 [Candidatus Fluviicola riflensis]OGS87141.1 MAG: hypothetical protein A2724_06505 [Fluviicola sp. RIFCSPHIGHO2_01_FULL_43_53]OGS89930.1 MAG: hypothetical protein A3E30_03250 [Fluviicola sp. RIFCSPHIGHO2_12_FULL_43_24]
MRLLVIITVFVSGFANAQSYSENLEQERVSNNKQMRYQVLDSTERAGFKGICYFPIDTNYVVDATFIRKKGKKFVMPMTTERTVYYRQYGVLQFRIHDTLCELTVYENLGLKGKEYENYLFLPFRDGTTALSTYGGGRYVDLEKQSGTDWEIDFNRAYHPYCVYSHRYSCPIPPKENTVLPFVTAGECYVTEE